MKTIKLLILFLAICLLSWSFGCAKKIERASINTQNLRGAGKVYFIPLDDFPLLDVEKLVDYYQNKYKLEITVLPSLTLDSSVNDPQRRQIIAEAVIDLMKVSYPNLANDPQAILIGLTTRDMYTTKYNWRFTFGWRQAGHFAVVSNARMKLGTWPTSTATPDEQESRLRKMVTKNIGIMYYGLPQNNDPRSVLYSDIGGIEELDEMGEDFLTDSICTWEKSDHKLNSQIL